MTNEKFNKQMEAISEVLEDLAESWKTTGQKEMLALRNIIGRLSNELTL